MFLVFSSSAQPDFLKERISDFLDLQICGCYWKICDFFACLLKRRAKQKDLNNVGRKQLSLSCGPGA